MVSLELLEGRSITDRKHLAQHLAHDNDSVSEYSIAIINTEEGSVDT